MNRSTLHRSRPSAVAPMAGWGCGFPIVAGLRRELFKEFARSAWPASRNGKAETHVRNPQSNLPLSHPASSLPPLPGSHAAGPVPPAGRTYSSRLVRLASQRLGVPHARTSRSDDAARAC
jgi:hypothetical protein